MPRESKAWGEVTSITDLDRTSSSVYTLIWYWCVIVLMLCCIDIVLYCYDDYNDNDGSVSISNMISSIQS